ncbi:MAG TPA: DUF4394 domain-containing protein [Chthoniobacterales bacterium]|jgi:hypothetical protein|nr:DUF4394 domain-containing protein [Chthoniobacterales bacterium]
MTPAKYRIVRVVVAILGMLLWNSPGFSSGVHGADWSRGTALPAAHVRGVGVYFPANGRFYVMGGRTSDAAGSELTRPYEYDASTNTWTVKNATIPDNQGSNMACGVLTVSGTPYIYCVGGSAAAATTSTNRVFRYNPITDAITTAGLDAWTEAAANTLPGGFTVFQNKLYIFGGFTINVGMSNRIYEFNPTNAPGSQWALKSTVLPVAMGYIPTATIGSLIFMAGGSTFPGGLVTDTDNSFVYNPVADAISPITKIPRVTGETRALNVGNEMWVLGGGRTAPNPSAEVNIYNPTSGQWRTGPPMTVGRRNFPADTDGAVIGVAGGYTPTAASHLLEIYGPTPLQRLVFYGINQANNNLVRFDNTDPLSVASVPITGLVGGDTILGLDFRPATGELFGLSSGSRIYTINRTTGAGTQRGNDGAFTLSGTSFGFDFNPVPDRIRVVSDNDQNLRLNPSNGTLTATDSPLVYDNTTADGDPIDTFSGTNPTVTASAYTNSFAGSTVTTLYGIDTNLNILVIQNPPNSGTLNTVGFLGIDPTDANGFDIHPLPGGTNLGFAALSTNGTSSTLYSLNLATGVCTQIGTGSIGANYLLRGLTVGPVGVFQFSAPSYSVGESGPVATITINRIGGSEGDATVAFTTSDGTALSGADYTDSDQVVTFGNGVTSQTVQIPLNNDGSDEFDETILLGLQNATGGALLGTPNTATLTITDDDVFTPTLTTQASQSGSVGEPVFITATISGSATPGGTLTFQLFGPNDNSCGGSPIFTSVVSVNGNGNYNSGSFTPTAPGEYTWSVTYSGDGDHNAPVSSGCGGPHQSGFATETVLGNISTRLRVETGDNALFAGFIVTGTQPKKVIVRALGPSLTVAGPLADPILEIYTGSTLVESNDNWVDSPNKQAILDSTIPPSNDLESAVVGNATANGTAYTAIVRGVNNGTGVALVEVYDLDRTADSRLANISTRGLVQTGDNILIAGTIVLGKYAQKVIVRAIGPSLSLPGKLDDPTLELRDQHGLLIQANDNWVDSPDKQAIIDTTIPPSNDFESAIVQTLPASNAAYTAIVRGVNDSTGIAVVEIYALQ